MSDRFPGWDDEQRDDYEDHDGYEVDEDLEEEDEDLEDGDDDEDEADDPFDLDVDALDIDGDPDSELTEIVEVSCPYCGVEGEIAVDPVGGDVQEYVEDCEVCCQPWSVRVALDPAGGAAVEVSRLDEG